MANSNPDVSERDIRRLVQGELNATEADAVRAVLRQSKEARRLYDRLVRAERVLEGAGEGLGDSANARIKARLFAEPAPAVAAPRGAWFSWPFMVAGAAAALAVFMMPPPAAENPPSEYRARGAPPVAISPERVLQVLQVSAGADGGFDVRPAETLRRGDELRFAVFVKDAPCRVSVVAVDEEGHRQVLLMQVELHPRPAAQRLDVALSVPDDWKGLTRFVGLFEFGDSLVDLSTVDLTARDEGELSVRVVRTTVVAEGSRDP